MLTVLLCVAFVLVLTLLHRRLTERPSNFPPGPPWQPLLGNRNLVAQLSKELGSQHAAFVSLSDQFKTPVLGLMLAGQLTVVVQTVDLVREVFTRHEFEGRPDTFFIRLRTMGLRKGITCVDGKLWHEQRAFVTRHLRSLGYGGAYMEDKVICEVQELLDELRNLEGGKGQLKPILAPAIMNILWQFVAGSRFPKDDKRLMRLLQLMELRTRAFDMAGSGFLSTFPWLRFFAPSSTGYKLMTELNSSLRAFFLETINEHKATYDPENKRDLIDAFIREIISSQWDTTTSTTFTDNQLLMMCYDFFVAGSETTSNTIRYAFLLMLLYPEVQQKVYEEIISVVGKDRLPSLEDKPRLPYTRAVIMESQRFCHIIPVIGPRRTLRDTTLHDYTLPKNTVVLINVWTLHNDKSHWGDPENFRPERFIRQNGQPSTDDWFVPFGLGRRRCLGEALAKSTIFLTFTSVIQNFELSPADSNNLNIKGLNGITLSPKPFNIVFKPR